jgi:hypothetical protein
MRARRSTVLSGLLLGDLTSLQLIDPIVANTALVEASQALETWAL